MKILKRILMILAVVMLVVVAAITAVVMVYSHRRNNYWKFTETNGAVEAKYTSFGAYEVAHAEFEAGDDVCKKYEVWYPTEMKESADTYPMVIIANGTGFPASQYQSFFKHLASWGFIVVGNEDGDSRTGASSAASLDFMLELNGDRESEFYCKIDVDKIGIGGHSQGGVGAINAVTNKDNGSYYKAMYTASTTSSYWGQENVLGTDWSYDVSKVRIPYFMVTGTGYYDAGTAEDITATEGQGICPLWSISENYEAIPDNVTKVMARLVDTDHGATLLRSDGYMTAWFMWQLCGDEIAARAFAGDDAEILNNGLYQDQQCHIAE